MGGGFSGERERKREPEGVCRVFYKQEPRGGSGVLCVMAEVAEVHAKAGSCRFRPYRRAGKAYSLHILLHSGSRIA